MDLFSDRVVVITGSSGNLGRVVADAFYHAGAALALVDLNHNSCDEESVDSGRKFRVAGDLLSSVEADAVIEKIIKHYGRIDVLVNIAGGFVAGAPVHETSRESWEYMLNLNAGTAFNTARAVVSGMRAQGRGWIINTSARAALAGKAGMAAYVASKSAVIRLTETLAEENKREGLNVNCVLPGILDTPLNRLSMPQADFSSWVSPEALADVVLFLASDASRAINGASIPVYGTG
ncbi:SDR family NAD(P)-dependent oxidoreductase [Chlorobium phaeobacteroides]|jgi:NAD(P)-dependent dehydrogenase (short-subunit alcohol dehydrogenase family)|uniref:Short-chain dehydrogenase/reductase SDR n=1 Tax=Chlorobium phaeobacteroides (strain DSM 266 / SMG 266 / 2430) TaxID=290317 RepID=A1BIX6_CHLPD|nr:SDR family NAD(P)-dependent oxidoreductase [Chlorobium phaeobacteroides]ABL66353.1 short-chain dehydrogenase/reductase SDR [Chlorobium phaeobacteroides DSM 266]MBV5319738.1 SDR family NAD(P)-dependent oxidoreductase [Chlorobium phaeobacteroides]